MPIQLSGSLVITGSITTTGVITMSGSIASASYSSTSDLLQGTGSVGFTTTASFNAVSSSQQQISASQQQISASFLILTASFNAVSASQQQISSSQQQISASLLNVIAVYATTGSNSFRATQSITGSLTVTGQIIAQTLNVQQVTSSIIYSSGSNNFGCDLNSRQTFTGSVLITGSLTIAGASSAASYSGTTIYGSTAVCSPVGLFSGCVGIGTANPLNLLHVSQPSANTVFRLGNNSAYDQFIYFNGNSDWSIGMDYSNCNAFVISNNSSLGTNDRVVLTTSGNLGLGVTPSNAYADSRTFEIGAGGILWSEQASSVYNSMSIGSNFYYNAAGDLKYKNSGVAASRFTQYQGSHIWYTAGVAPSAGAAITFTQAMLLNSSGNLGIGVTPSVWSLGKAIEIGNLGHAIWSVNATQYNIMYNAYYNGGFVYASSNPASYYQQASGAHTWYNAPSGTIGCAITFCPAMALNACSRLLVGSGVTDNGASIQTNGDIRADYSSAIYLEINGGAAGDYRKGFSGVNQQTGVARGLHIFNYDPDSSQGIKFFGGTYAAKARFGGFDSGGNFFVNSTDSAEGYKLYVNGNAAINSTLLVNGALTSNGTIISNNTDYTGRYTTPALSLTGGSAGGGGQTYTIGNSGMVGMLVVSIGTQNVAAIFLLNGGNPPIIVSQSTTETRFSVTSGSLNTANVYLSGANLVLENNIQATRTFYTTFIGKTS